MKLSWSSVTRIMVLQNYDTQENKENPAEFVHMRSEPMNTESLETMFTCYFWFT